MTQTLNPQNNQSHPVVSHDEWLSARQELLKEEKELTYLRDKLSAKRRQLPWEKVEKDYSFDGPKGRESLGDLFEGRSQLIIQHFMFGPEWEEGCTGCSFLADHIEGALPHLTNHDVTLVVVSRAPLAKLEAFRKRMGWKFKWVSSFGSDFNFDYYASYSEADKAKGKVFQNYKWDDYGMDEISGHSVFTRDSAGEIFHTTSTFSRGDEQLIGTYNYLDMTPKGRNENGPHHNLMDWVKHHDRYADSETKSSCCH